MNENGQESAEPTLRQMVERYREQKRKGNELVQAMFREALERERKQQEQQRLLVEQVHREAIERGRTQPLPPYKPPTVHYTELPAAQPDSQLYQEWNFYRREVGRLLAEGEEGRFVLIKGENIIGIWHTQEEAEAVAFHKYPLEPRLIHQVQRCERVLRTIEVVAMPRLVYPIDPHGLVVDVVIGLSGLSTSSLLASGQAITAPLRLRGLIDTGTDVTAVSAVLLQRLGVAPSHPKTTQTVSGQLSVRMFVVSLGITDFGDPAAAELVEPDLTVMELVAVLPQAIDVLIGLDVLRGCKFVLDGPANWFSLEF